MNQEGVWETRGFSKIPNISISVTVEKLTFEPIAARGTWALNRGEIGRRIDASQVAFAYRPVGGAESFGNLPVDTATNDDLPKSFCDTLTPVGCAVRDAINRRLPGTVLRLPFVHAHCPSRLKETTRETHHCSQPIETNRKEATRTDAPRTGNFPDFPGQVATSLIGFCLQLTGP